MAIRTSRRARPIPWLVTVVVLIPLLAAAAHATDQRSKSSWHAAEVWRQAQGLPQNSVLTILQTRDSYMWIGTKGGLSRFDGVHFTTFDDRNTNQLKENEVWALAEDDEGGLWIGTYGGGLSRLKDGKFTTYWSAMATS